MNIMIIPKRVFYWLFCSLLFCSTAFAQDKHILAVQESIPKPDSGGRWVPFNVDFTNLTQDTVRLYLHGYEYTRMRSLSYFQLAPSVHHLADTFTVSLTPGNLELDTEFQFILLPHSKSPDLRMPYIFRVVAYEDIPYYISFEIPCRLNVHDTGGFLYIDCKGFASCSGPWMPFDGRPISNENNPYDPVSGTSVLFSNGAGQDYDAFNALTKATYRISGEFSDRFILPRDTTYRFSDIHIQGSGQLTFLGAPKYLVHATLHCTYTSCWGTDIIDAPIEAYSAYRNTYKFGKASGDLKAPFLGHTEGTVTVTNLTHIPITVKDLAVGGNDSINFTAESPGVIAAGGSGDIRIIFRDNNIPEDLKYQQRHATLRGTVVPASADLPFIDSAFTFALDGTIDVYSPNYFSLLPQIKHGIHPAGIIFRSDRKDFITIFGNDDSVSEFFYPPYYDDPHFGISISDINLPAMVLPDTGIFAPNAFQAKTTFTGDDSHNYLTQLHWPRGKDTVTIDVLAVGLNAPPFNAVAPVQAGSTLSLWPNPASTTVNFESNKGMTVWISDALGRILRKITLPAGSMTLDVSTMPSGLYEVSAPSLKESLKLYIVR